MRITHLLIPGGQGYGYGFEIFFVFDIIWAMNGENRLLVTDEPVDFEE